MKTIHTSESALVFSSLKHQGSQSFSHVSNERLLPEGSALMLHGSLHSVLDEGAQTEKQKVS